MNTLRNEEEKGKKDVVYGLIEVSQYAGNEGLHNPDETCGERKGRRK